MSKALEEFIWVESARIEGVIRYSIGQLSCSCGCGEALYLDNKRSRGRYYIMGPHGQHGFINLDEGQPPEFPDYLPELTS